MKKKSKEIDWKKTLISSIWIYALLAFINVNAILFAVRAMRDSGGAIDSICFWGLISLMLVTKFVNWLVDLTFFVYKK